MNQDRYQQVAQLSAEQKRALLTQLLVKKNADMSPLSYGQQALWFLDQLAPESGAYNETVFCRLYGICDTSILQNCFQELVDRHPILRTIYVLHEQKPIQKVLEHHQVHFTITDTTSWSAEEREQYLQQEIYQPINLAQGPVFRVQILKVNPEEHLLVVIVHHIAIDVWSLTVLFDELISLYSAYSAGRHSSLPPVKVQYRDYVRWQEAMLASPKGSALRAYWEKQLDGFLPVLQLPTDHPRPAIQIFSGAIHTFAIDKQLSQQLKTLAQEHNISLYTLLLSAFQVLLFRYTGQNDILISSPTNGRTQSALDRAVGYYVNPVVLRARLPGTATFSALLQQTHQTVIEALEHQDYPFSLLVNHLQPQRDPSRAPLCDVAFIMEQVNHLSYSSTPMSENNTGFFARGTNGTHVRMGELDVEMVNLEQQKVKFDLSLEMTAVGETISGGFQYTTALFDTATISNLTEHFQSLLQSIVKDADQPIELLPLYTDQERDRILTEWNATETRYPSELGLHQLIEQQVERTPDAIALVFEEQQITYRELNTRANQLASWLRTQGVTSEVLVGVCMERSVELVIALLGILKAGGAYIPLDPQFPQERLRYILAEAHAPLLLTQQRIQEQFSDLPTPMLCLDREEEWLSESYEEWNTPPISGNQLAYLIYTSGSTGRPKGVQISHRALVNFLCSMQRQPGIHAQDCMLALTTITFDIAGLELYGPLSVGARLVLASPQAASDSEQLEQLLLQQATTIVQATPTTWHLLELGGWRPPSSLKVLCGGEALPLDLAQFLLSQGVELWNMYGPTETTIWSTCERIEAGREEINIGRPIANTQIYVLDTAWQPVPPGVVGELYIGGAGLARGYYGQAALTAQRFLPDPFSQEPGARLYRTGDLARYRSDGRLECLGRTDQQIKLRGFRIELGEIEAVLKQHPAIKQSIVMLHKVASTNHYLTAYLVVDDEEETIHPDELRRYLRGQLPLYMIPTHFISLQDIPLLSNGKINYRALPIPQEIVQTIPAEDLSAYTPTEQWLSNICAELIGVPQVTKRQNFFEIGGHSLMATQVLNHIREKYRIEIPLHTIFEMQTIVELAKTIDALQLAQEITSHSIEGEEEREEGLL